MSVVRLEFDAFGMNESDHSIRLPPAPRLRTLMEREERFWRERSGKTTLSYDGIPMPPEYASGTATFGGMEFYVTPAVMIPRKGTEALVDRAISLYNKTHGIDRRYKGPRASILDLGTGSGCLLLTLLDRTRDSFGVGIDVSHEAILVAESNAAALGLDGNCYFARGSFAKLHTEVAHDKFNVVVCNPPYHTQGGRKILDSASVTHEPDIALYIDGKDDYLIHYRDALKSLTDLVTSKAVVVFEVFRDNAEGVAKLMREAGLEDVEIGTDANGCIRTAEGIFPEKVVG
jgi:release factor glutamine methyltransferase